MLSGHSNAVMVLFLNNPLGIVVAPSANLIALNDLHPENISDALPVRLAGNVISSNLVQSINAAYPASFKESERITVTRFLHPLKA